jgi:preprotein translocase subunit SecA
VLGGKEPKLEEFANPEDFEKEHQAWEERHNQVLARGGLHVIGTERHEARRIDNQLRGRSGRQGDPGSTRFYVALDDDIMKRFGGDRIKTVMSWVGLDENTPIENGMVSKTIENSQVKVEGYHFDIRKHLVEFDDVVNKQREVIYCERRKVLSGADLKKNILDMVNKEIDNFITQHIGSRTNDEWDIPGLIRDLNTIFPLPKEITADSLAQLNPGPIKEKLMEYTYQAYEQKEKEVGAQDMRLLERLVMLRVMDELWVEHLTEMENQRQQAGFAGLQQMKSEDLYKQIGYSQFQVLLDTIQQDVARMIFHVSIRREPAKEVSTPISRRAAQDTAKSTKEPVKAGGQKIGRNDPCPCGSGKKYKHCCGRS